MVKDIGGEFADLFFDKVKEMRAAQKEYFRTRSSTELQKAKRLEKEVDEWIKQEESDNNEQQKLF